ncbi:CheR family methyltransferase [Chondromyces crocatus]|nr:protein-glutamate O-methyltransferase CheR [Chondromyces crocatus]
MIELDRTRARTSAERGSREPQFSSLPPSLFRAFRDLAAARSGIQIRDGKETLVATRIAGRMGELGLDEPAAYLARLREDPSGVEMIRFLDALCTTFTGFYRDAEHFTLLASEAARRLSRGQQRMRVWCAATASGEEAYSTAMVLSEAVANTEVDYRVLATDLSTSALRTAIQGRYSQQQLTPVSERLRAKYFIPVPTDDGTSSTRFEVSQRLRERVSFARLNLAAPPFPIMAPFDVILCRNVMIYFDPQVRQRLLDELTRLLRPGGLLLVGHAETLSGLQHQLTPVQPSALRKPRVA